MSNTKNNTTDSNTENPKKRETSFHEKQVLSPSPETLSDLDDVCELDKIYCPCRHLKVLGAKHFMHGFTSMSEVLASMMAYAIDGGVDQNLLSDYVLILVAFQEGALSERDREDRDAYCEVIS